MHKISRSSGEIIAADTEGSVQAVDQAVLNYSRLCASIVEVSGASRLPVSACQPALAKLVTGLNALVEGRGHIAGATRDLLKVQGASTLRETGFGCPNGLPSLSGELDVAPVSARATA